MTNRRDKLTALEARMADIERYSMHLYTVLVHILDQVPVPTGMNYALLALTYRFTNKQEDIIWDFLRWAYSEHGAGKLTRERLLAEWDARAPQEVRGKLEEILKAHEADRGEEERLS